MPNLTASALAIALAILPALAHAQEDGGYVAVEEDTGVTPDSAAPAWTPPAPPAEPPAAPQAPQAQATPPGQWVYTQQYGWLWMPYADGYTHVPVNGSGEPYSYVYYPAYSTWTWVAAPWVWGYGPWPVFGVWGPARFGWYGHGWWRQPARWHYAPAHAWYPGGGWRAAAPYRGWGGGPRYMTPGRGGSFGVVHGGAAIGGHAYSGGHGGGHGGGRGGGHGRR